MPLVFESGGRGRDVRLLGEDCPRADEGGRQVLQHGFCARVAG